MVNFRKTLMVVASLAVCAGLALAGETGVVIPTGSANVSFTAALVRSEGVTEAMPTVAFNNVVVPADAHYDVTIISLNAPITSATAALKFNGKAAASIAGNAATFSQVKFTAATTSFTLDGLRIDATQLPSLSSGQTTGLGENILIIMSSTDGTGNAAPFDGTSPVTTVTGLAFSVKSLSVTMANGTSSDTKSTSYFRCDKTPFDPTYEYTLALPPTAAFDVNLSEGFGTAWQPKAFVSATEPGEGSGATQGTQISLTFTNVPANVTLYVPATYTNSDNLNLKLVVPSTLNMAKDNINAAVPANGTVVYEVEGSTSVADVASIPVYVSFNAKSLPDLTASAAPLTVTALYAPQSKNNGPSGDNDLVPRFLGAAQTSHAIPFSITPCSTTILFPYITNQPGYETGLAISNVGNLTTNGGQSGVCQWSFYGDGAPKTAVAPTAAVAPGTTFAATLTGIGVTGFTGFAVATCDFQAGYGYAYIADYVTGQTTAQGYLGLLIGQPVNPTWGFFPSAE